MHSKCTLFSVSSADLAGIEERRRRILTARQALNTRLTYRSGWGIFVRWCAEAKRNSLPATSE
ncbi:MAG: hypothetical protein ACRD4O_12540, partial [Bryobacteraceae bacterium]